MQKVHALSNKAITMATGLMSVQVTYNHIVFKKAWSSNCMRYAAVLVSAKKLTLI